MRDAEEQLVQSNSLPGTKASLCRLTFYMSLTTAPRQGSERRAARMQRAGTQVHLLPMGQC